MMIEYAKNGSIGTITLNNPPQNELVGPVFGDLAELTDFLAAPELKAAVVTGAGKNFSAGASRDKLAELKHIDQGELQSLMTGGKALLSALDRATVPLVAVIRGSCLGAGLEIALSCHFRYASSNAMFGFPEAEYGLMPGLGGTLSAGKTAHRSAAMELMLSGKMVRGEEAKQMGLVDASVATKDLEARAQAFIASLTERRSADLIRTIMTAIQNGTSLSTEQALLEETRLFCGLVAAQKEKEN